MGWRPPLSVELAREMGFCFGVRRAIRILEAAVQQYGHLDSLGPVVHNQQVVARLEGLGVRVAHSLAEVQAPVVVVTAHGVAPEVSAQLQEQGRQVVDATCPLVRRAQRAAQGLAREGFRVVVFGDPGHPEVVGVLGWAGDEALAVQSIPLALQPWPKRLGLLAQTTQVPEDFARFISSALPVALSGESELRVVNTICGPTRRRRAAARELARRCQLVLVVGDPKSANTRRLAQLCSALVETHLVERPEDIDPSWLRGKEPIGITAGASTPDEAIHQVVRRAKELIEN